MPGVSVTDNTLVSIGEGVTGFSAFKVTKRLEGGGRVELLGVFDGRRYVCREVSVSTVDGAVTADMLREVQIGQLMREGIASVTRFAGQEMRTDRPDTSKGPTVDALRAVATIYRQAFVSGDPPKKAVAAALGLPSSTAGRWIMKAREAGLLGSTEERRPGI